MRKKIIITNIFKVRQLNILAPNETRVKGTGVQEWKGKKVITSGVSEECMAKGKG